MAGQQLPVDRLLTEDRLGAPKNLSNGNDGIAPTGYDGFVRDANGNVILPTPQNDLRYQKGTRISWHPLIMAKAVTSTFEGEDITADLSALCAQYEEVIIDKGTFKICTAKDNILDLETDGSAGYGVVSGQVYENAPVSRIRRIHMLAGTKLLWGSGTARRRGKWKYEELIVGGKTPAWPARGVDVHDASVYKVNDWIFIASRFNLWSASSGSFNFGGVLRKIRSVNTGTNVIGIDLPLKRSYVGSARVLGFVRSNANSTVIPVDDASSFSVGTQYDIVNAWARNVKHNNVTVTARSLTEGANTITLSTSYSVVQGDYLIAATGVWDYMPGPWIVRCQLQEEFNFHVDDGAYVMGKGLYDPDDDPADQRAGNMFDFELCYKPSITGGGFLGMHPTTMINSSNNVEPVWGAHFEGVFNNATYDSNGNETSGSGYDINENGATRESHVTSDARLLRARHGYTTNTGPVMWLRLDGAMTFSFPRGSNATNWYNLGSQGEPEDGLIEPAEVGYCTNAGIDTHRPGLNNTIIINNMHDNGGGVTIRADLTTVIGRGAIDGVNYSSAVTVQSIVWQAAQIINVHVRRIYGHNQVAFSLAGPAVAKDCSVEMTDMSTQVIAFQIGSSINKDRRVIIQSPIIRDIHRAFRFENATGATVFDPIIEPSSVRFIAQEAGAAVGGDNQIIISGEPFGVASDTGERWFTADFATITTGSYGADTQGAAQVRLPAGILKSLGITVTTAAAGATVSLALYSTGVTGVGITDSRLASVTIDASTVGDKEGVLATPFDLTEGGNYWLAYRVDNAAVSFQRGNLVQGRAVSSLASLTGNLGRAIQKNSGGGSWLGWSSVSSVAHFPRIGAKVGWLG